MKRILAGGLLIALLVPTALGQAPGGLPAGFDPQALRRLSPVLQAMNELLSLIGDLGQVDAAPQTRLDTSQAAAVT